MAANGGIENNVEESTSEEAYGLRGYDVCAE